MPLFFAPWLTYFPSSCASVHGWQLGYVDCYSLDMLIEVGCSKAHIATMNCESITNEYWREFCSSEIIMMTWVHFEFYWLSFQATWRILFLLAKNDCIKTKNLHQLTARNNHETPHLELFNRKKQKRLATCHGSRGPEHLPPATCNFHSPSVGKHPKNTCEKIVKVHCSLKDVTSVIISKWW